MASRMPSRMPALPFVSTTSEIAASEAEGIPGLGAVVEHWTEGAYGAAEWFEEVGAIWGSAGLVARRGEDTLGFAVYGPPELLPGLRRYRVGVLGEDAALLAYVGGDRRTRRHLLTRVLREMRLRGSGGVEAVGDDLGLRSGVVTPTAALLESGWKPVRGGFAFPSGLPCTLLRAELGSAVEVGEFARGLVDLVRLPVLKSPVPNLTPADGAHAARVRRGERGAEGE